MFIHIYICIERSCLTTEGDTKLTKISVFLSLGLNTRRYFLSLIFDKYHSHAHIKLATGQTPTRTKEI